MLPGLGKEEHCRLLLEQEHQEKQELEQEVLVQEELEQENKEEEAATLRVAQLGKSHQRARSDTSTIDFR